MLSIINLGHQLQNSVVHLVNVVRLEYFHCIPDWDFVWDNTSSFTQCLSRQFGNSFVDASQPGSALESASYVKTQPHWTSVEQRLRSAANCFPVRVESVWREAVAGGLSFPFANWIVRLFSKLGVWHCFWSLLIGQVGSDFFVYAAFLQVLRVRNSFSLSREERFKRGISVAMMMKTFIPRTNSRNIWIL